MESSEFLLNMNPRNIPPPESDDYDDFWANERYKSEYGLTVNGVFISPFLYWHTQLWNIYDDIEDDINNSIKRIKMKASFRDNEWIISDALIDAQNERKGVMVFGSRRLGKSEFISSYIGQGATLFEGTENVIMGGNWGDIDVIMAKVDFGLNSLPEYFVSSRLANNLRKEIELGYKDKKGKRLSWSKIIARNHEEGNDTESPAGLTPSRFIMDEVGKSSFARVFEAAKPSFTSKFGWRCVPILTGTSGDIKSGSDAENFFKNPNSQNFIVRELKEEGNKKVSVFISGFYRMEGKVETTLGNFIQNEKGILIPEESELHTIPAFVKDNDKAEKVIDQEREQAKESPDPGALLKAIMYYPKNTTELFLSDDGNKFPIEAINEQIEYLLANEEMQGQPIRLYKDTSNKVKISFNTNKKPMIDYPVKPGNFKNDACIVMFEPPDENSLFSYLYISGADPYNQSSSKYSNSLGSCYIMKRIYDPIDGTFQRRIVCCYTARPDSLKEFHENVEMMLEIYGAVCMPENEATSFIQYFDLKNKGHYLADGYNFLKEISPSTSITNRPKGLPAIPRVKNYYKELVYQYLTEEIIVGINPETKENIVKMGVIRINDIGLLRELAAYNDEGNFDRYVAFGHTLAHEVWADKMYPFIEPTRSTENVMDNKKVRSSIRNPFGINPGLGGLKSNPFGVSPLTKGNPFS